MTEPLQKKNLRPTLDNHPATACKGCKSCQNGCELLGGEETPRELFRRDDLSTLAYQCTLCGLCDQLCPFDVEVSEAFRAERERAVEKNRHPRLAWAGRRGFEQLGQRGPLRTIVAPPGADTLLFPGCNLSGMRPDSVMRLWRTLREKDPKLGLLFDCCGVITRDMGDRAGFAENAERMRASLTRRGIRKIISACPSCHKTLQAAQPELEMVTAVEALRDVPFTALASETAPTEKLILHDPCSARAEPGYHDSVREMARTAGLTLVEPRRSAETTFCCSDGGWNEMEPGETVVTSCAGCMQTLSKRTPARHLFDFWFGTGEATVPSLLRQLINRWRLIRRAEKAVHLSTLR